MVVDASGDAAAAFLGGAETETAPPELLQCPSYVFRLEGVDTSGLVGFERLKLGAALASGVRAGALPSGADSVVVRGSARAGEVFATLNLGRPDGEPWAPLDPACVARLEARARAAAEAIAAFLRETRPAFKDAALAELPRRLGVRETRRVRGVAQVSADDVLAGRALATTRSRSRPGRSSSGTTRAGRSSSRRRARARCRSARWCRARTRGSAWRGAVSRRRTRRSARCA